MKRTLVGCLMLLACSKSNGEATPIDKSELGQSPVIASAPPMPTGGRREAPWAEPPPSKIPAAMCGDCVRMPDSTGRVPDLDTRLGMVVGIDPIDATRYRAQLRVTGHVAPAGARFESVVVAEPGEIIPTVAGRARILDVRVVSPKSAQDGRWYAYAVVQPIDPDWSSPKRDHLFVTSRGMSTLAGWSFHLDEPRRSLTGPAATLTARGSRELVFTVQAGTVFELDGARYEVIDVQPAVDQNIGWVEIDALPKR